MSSHFKKEWIGESGYCNCILVMMSRIDSAKMELATNLPLPNLEDLAAPREATVAGGRAQDIHLFKLNKVIETLSIAPGCLECLGLARPERSP